MMYLEGVRYKRINALSIAPYLDVHVLKYGLDMKYLNKG